MADGIAVLQYRHCGVVRQWVIGCDADRDNAETIRAHLLRWIPGAELVAYEIRRASRGAGFTAQEQTSGAGVGVDE